MARAAPLLGLVTAVLLLCAHIAVESSLVSFMVPSAALMGPLTTFLLIVATHGWTETQWALVGGFRQWMGVRTSSPWSHSDCLRAMEVAKTGQMLAIHTGILGATVHTCAFLYALDDPSRIGPALVPVIFCLLYSMEQCLFFFIPLSRYLQGAAEPPPAGRPGTVSGLGASCS